MTRESYQNLFPGDNSPGAHLVRSPEFQQLNNRRGTKTLEIDLPTNSAYHSSLGASTRATLTGTGLTSIDKDPAVILLNAQPPTLRDIIPEIPTDETTIRYTQETSYSNGAAAIAEEGEYQETSFNLEEVDAPVRKIGVIAKVTDEQMEDHAYMRDYINNRLRDMVQQREDGHLLNGTGLTNQIKGILEFAGIQSQAQGGNTALDAIHKGINKVRTVAFWEPDAVVIHPNDWEGLRLMKDADGKYIFGDPFTNIPPAVWGKPCILTTAIAQGGCLVGAFKLGAAIRRRLGIVVEFSNANGDDFKNGRVSIRATTRLALPVYRPLAFCEVTGLQ